MKFKKHLGALAFATVVAGGCAEPPTRAADQADASRAAHDARLRERTEGVYLVMLAPSVHGVDGHARKLLNRYSLAPRDVYEEARFFSAKLTPAQAEELGRDPSVAAISPNRVVMPRSLNIQQNAQWGLDRVSPPADGLFPYTETGAGVNVYIVDKPVNGLHMELSPRVVGYVDATRAPPLTETATYPPCYGGFHGTAVASVAAGTTVGVAKGAPITSVIVLSCEGEGNTTIEFVNGLMWVANHAVKPAVANVSVGECAGIPNPGGGGPGGFPAGQTGGCTETISPMVDQAIQAMVSAGVTVVVAAGNASADACNNSPAHVSTAMAIGAVDSTLAMWSGSDYGKCVAMFAPGVNVLVANDTSTTKYAVQLGTSLAAPFVTGVVALYLQAHPTATPAQVRTAMLGRAASNQLTGIGTGSPNLFLQYLLTLQPVTMSGPFVGNDQYVTVSASPPLGMANLYYVWSYTFCRRDNLPSDCNGERYAGPAGYNVLSETEYVHSTDVNVVFRVEARLAPAGPVIASNSYTVEGADN